MKSYESGSDDVLEGIRLKSQSGDNLLLKLDRIRQVFKVEFKKI